MLEDDDSKGFWVIIAMATVLGIGSCSVIVSSKPSVDQPQSDIEKREQDYLQGKPELVIEHEGVKVWKVRDQTPHGASTVYFTTNGCTMWTQNKNSISVCGEK